MGNISNTRFQYGVTNVNETNLFADMVQPDPTLFHEYFNDFDTYTAGDWTVTETDSMRYKATERYAFGWTDPRGVYGTPGI